MISGAILLAAALQLLLPSGERVGTLPGEKPPGAWKRSAEHTDQWETGFWAAKNKGVLQIILAEGTDDAPSPSPRAVMANELELETAAGVGFAKLYCAETDVLRQDGERWLVRAHQKGAILEGFVQKEPRHVEWGNCVSRTTREASYPAHYQRADPAAPGRVKLSGDVWWDDGGGWNDKKGCVQWTFRKRDGVLRLEHQFKSEACGGLLETTMHYNFEGATAERVEMYMVAGDQRWIRKPRDGCGVPGMGPGSGIYGLSFVQESREAIEWVVAGDRPTAYHPADSVKWYRTRAVCEAAQSPTRR